MSNVCTCVFVEDGERKQLIFLGRSVEVTYFNKFGHFETYTGVLKDADNSLVFLDLKKYIYIRDIIDIRLSD